MHSATSRYGTVRGNQPRWQWVCALLLGSACGVICGCGQGHQIRATHYDMQLAIDPPSHMLEATTRVRCAPVGGEAGGSTSPATVEFELHPDLEVEEVVGDGVRVVEVTSRPGKVTEDDQTPATVHRVTLDSLPESFGLTFHYKGRLQQDVAAGEERGEIHNFAVSAHIGEEGTYLDQSARWYPALVLDDGTPSDARLAKYEMEIEPVEGYVFEAGADPVAVSGTLGAMRFASGFPQTDMALIGGPYRRWTREVDGVRFGILLHEDETEEAVLEERADLFMSAAIAYMKRYVPLVGPYPFDEFTIVENFFSSGFAFPTFTLLGPVVIQMGERSLRHGYLDHELLHSWWGNAIYVDPDGGNWCEALASFGGNLYGFVLDGDEKGARNYRRDACNMLSRLPADSDKPLATFGEDGGAGRGIGYQKGAMVFHMLCRRLGDERFWEAMRTLTARYTGRFADWEAIRSVCEEQAEADLEPFFDQWVYGSGAPLFRLAEARMASSDAGAGGRALVRITQEGGPFAVELPLRVHNGDGTVVDVKVPVSKTREEVSVEGVVAPAEIELDPEFQVIRKMVPVEMLPTLSGTTRGEQCQIVTPTGELWDGYDTFIEDIRKNRKPDSVTQTAVGDALELAAGTLVLVGDAVRHPSARELLARSECPVQWNETGFTIDGTVYDDPGQAVLCTIRHPDAEGRTITIYYGNSPEALSNAGILWFYGNSLLVYQTPPGESGETGAPRAEVIVRKDFERSHRIAVAPTPASKVD